MIRLHVNIDHVATIRNARGTPYPDPTEAAKLCMGAGAHGITAHLREDRRHIVDADVERIRRELPTTTFNLEMAATDEMVGIALRVGPNVVTLVPERREERTTEGGLDVIGGGATLAARVKRLVDAGIKVSLFIAPAKDQIVRSKEIGAAQIELHTGEYAHATVDAIDREVSRLAVASSEAARIGLEVAAGHGLTRDNVLRVAAIPEIVEVNIGHSMVADAVFMSLAGSVRAMNDQLRLARSSPR